MVCVIFETVVPHENVSLSLSLPCCSFCCLHWNLCHHPGEQHCCWFPGYYQRARHKVGKLERGREVERHNKRGGERCTHTHTHAHTRTLSLTHSHAHSLLTSILRSACRACRLALMFCRQCLGHCWRLCHHILLELEAMGPSLLCNDPRPALHPLLGSTHHGACHFPALIVNSKTIPAPAAAAAFFIQQQTRGLETGNSTDKTAASDAPTAPQASARACSSHPSPFWSLLYQVYLGLSLSDNIEVAAPAADNLAPTQHIGATLLPFNVCSHKPVH